MAPGSGTETTRRVKPDWARVTSEPEPGGALAVKGRKPPGHLGLSPESGDPALRGCFSRFPLSSASILGHIIEDAGRASGDPDSTDQAPPHRPQRGSDASLLRSPHGLRRSVRGDTRFAACRAGAAALLHGRTGAQARGFVGTEPGRGVDALHRHEPRLGDGRIPDRHPPGVAVGGRRVGAAADLHRREGRDGSGLGAGRVVLRVLFRPGGERRRGRERRPALHDAPRRRRGAKDHRRRGWSVRLRLRPGGALARLPLRQGRPGAALPAGGWRPGRGRCGADHRGRCGDRGVGLHPRWDPDLLHASRLVRRGRGGAAREGVHGRCAERRHAPLEPLERGGRDGRRAPRDGRPVLQRRRLHDVG